MKSIKKAFLTVLLLVMGFCSVSSQSGGAVIKGEILDENGMPLIGAVVLLWNGSGGYIAGTTTDFFGCFTIVPKVCSPYTFITVNFIGYEMETVLTPTYNGVTYVRVQMNEIK